MNTLSGPVALIKKGYEIFINNKILIYIALVPSIVSSITQVIYMIGGKSIPAPLIIIAILLSMISSVLSVLLISAMIDSVRRISEEPGVILSVVDQYKYSTKLFLPIIFVNLILVLTVIGGSALFVIPGIIIGVFASFAFFSLVIDGHRSFSAITDSYSLIKGRWWSVLGRLFGMSLIFMLFICILVAIIYLVSYLGNMPLYETVPGLSEKVPTTFGYISNILLNLIGSAIIIPISFGANYVLFKELKNTRLSDVNVLPFKRWLIALMVLAIIMFGLLLSLPILAVSLNEARQKAQKVKADSEYRQTLIQEAINENIVGTSSSQQ